MTAIGQAWQAAVENNATHDQTEKNLINLNAANCIKSFLTF